MELGLAKALAEQQVMSFVTFADRQTNTRKKRFNNPEDFFVNGVVNERKKIMCNFLHFLPALKLVHVFSILNTLTSVIREPSARVSVNHS